MTTYPESFGTAVGRKGRRSRRDVTRSNDNLRHKDYASTDAVNEERTRLERLENSSETSKRKKSKKTGKGRSISTSQLDGNFEDGQEKTLRPPSSKAYDAPETEPHVTSVQNGGHVIEAEGSSPSNLPEAEPERKTEKKKNKNKKLGRRSESRTSVLDEELVSKRSTTSSQGQQRSTSRGQRSEVESAVPFDLTPPLMVAEEEEREKEKRTARKAKKTKKVEEKEGVEEEEEKVKEKEKEEEGMEADRLVKDIIGRPNSDDVWLLFGMKLDVLCKFLLSDAGDSYDTLRQGQGKVKESRDVVDAELLVARTKKAPDKSPTRGEAAEDVDDGQKTEAVLLDSEMKFEGVDEAKQSDPRLKERRKKETKQDEITETPQEVFKDNSPIVADPKVRNDSEGQRSRDVNQIGGYHQNVSPTTEQRDKALLENGKATVAAETKTATPTETTATNEEATAKTGVATGKATAGRERQRNISREAELDSAKPETDAEKMYEKSHLTQSSTNDDDDNDDYDDSDDDDHNLENKQNSQLHNKSNQREEKIKIDQKAITPPPSSPWQQSSPWQPPSSLLPPLPPAPRTAPPPPPPPPRPSPSRPTGKRTLKPSRSEESLVKRRQPQRTTAETGREAEPETEVVMRRGGGSLRGAVSVERLAAGEPQVIKRRSLSREWKVTTLTTREEIVIVERGSGETSAAAHAQSSTIEHDVIEPAGPTGNRSKEEGKKKKMEFEYIDSEESFGDFLAWPTPPASPPSPPPPPPIIATTDDAILLSPPPPSPPLPPPPTAAAASTTLPLSPLPGEILPAATSGDVKSEQRRSDHVTTVKPEILGRKPTLSLYLYRNRSASASTARQPIVQKSTESEKRAAPVDPSDLYDLSSSATDPPFCPQTNSSFFEIEPEMEKIEIIQRQTGNARQPDAADNTDDRLDSVFADDPREWHGGTKKEQADIVVEAPSSSQGKSNACNGTDPADVAVDSKHSDFKTRDVMTCDDVIRPTVDEVANDRFELVADNRSSRSPRPRNAKAEVKKSTNEDQHSSSSSSYYVIAEDDCVSSPVVIHEYGEYLSFLKKRTVEDIEIDIRRTQRQREEILRRLEYLRNLRGAGPIEPLEPPFFSTGDPDSDRGLTTSRRSGHPLYSSGAVLDRGHSPPRERFHSVDISAEPSLTASSSEGVATSSNRPFSDSIFFYSVRNDGYSKQTEQSHRTQ